MLRRIGLGLMFDLLTILYHVIYSYSKWKENHVTQLFNVAYRNTITLDLHYLTQENKSKLVNLITY